MQGPQLVEINSRYSYMGWATHHTHDFGHHENHDDHHHRHLEASRELRNLVNKTECALGRHVNEMPSQACKEHGHEHEQSQVSKLALFVYTNKTGPIDTIIDRQSASRNDS